MRLLKFQFVAKILSRREILLEKSCEEARVQKDFSRSISLTTEERTFFFQSLGRQEKVVNLFFEPIDVKFLHMCEETRMCVFLKLHERNLLSWPFSKKSQTSPVKSAWRLWCKEWDRSSEFTEKKTSLTQSILSAHFYLVEKIFPQI